MNDDQVNELLYQALETEIGGQNVYEAAIGCAAERGTQGGVGEVPRGDADPRDDPARDVRPDRTWIPKSRRPAGPSSGSRGSALVKAMEMALREAGRSPHSWSPPKASWRRRPRTTRTGS